VIPRKPSTFDAFPCHFVKVDEMSRVVRQRIGASRSDRGVTCETRSLEGSERSAVLERAYKLFIIRMRIAANKYTYRGFTAVQIQLLNLALCFLRRRIQLPLIPRLDLLRCPRFGRHRGQADTQYFSETPQTMRALLISQGLVSGVTTVICPRRTHICDGRA